MRPISPEQATAARAVYLHLARALREMKAAARYIPILRHQIHALEAMINSHRARWGAAVVDLDVDVRPDQAN